MFYLANGTPKKKGRKKMNSDDSDMSFSGGSDVEFVTMTTLPVKERTTARRAAVKSMRYNFSDDENEDSSEGEPELFQNDAVQELDTHRQEKMDVSSESESERPPKQLETSEHMFDSLVGKL